MEATLQAHAVRQLKRILICLSRFGDEVHLHASIDGLQLSTINQSRSAFCLFTLDSKEFFHRYRFSPSNPAAPTRDSTQSSNKSIKCKLPVRAFLAVLSNTSTQPGNLDRLEMRIVDPGNGLRSKSRRERNRSRERTGQEGIESRLILKLVCKHGILKTHSLHLGPSPFLIAVVDPDTLTSSFTLSSKTLREWSEHFFFSLSSTSSSSSGSRHTRSANEGTDEASGPVKAESELGWMFDSDEVRVKTFDVGIGTSSGAHARPIMATEVRCGLDDFEDYFVREPPVVLAFPMKEFRAAFSLADQFSIPLATSFSQAGQPISITLKVLGIDATFAIATIARDLFASEIAAKKARREREFKPNVADVAAAEEARVQGSTSGGRKRDSQSAGLNVESETNIKAGPSGSKNGDGRASLPKKKATLDFSQDEYETSGSHRPGSRFVPDTASHENVQEPLFLPSASQDLREFSQREEVLRTGLGLENMDDDEIARLMGMDEDDEMALQDGAPARCAELMEESVEDAASEHESLVQDDRMRGVDPVRDTGGVIGIEDRPATRLQEHRQSSLDPQADPADPADIVSDEDDDEVAGSQIPPSAAQGHGRRYRAIYEEDLAL